MHSAVNIEDARSFRPDVVIDVGQSSVRLRVIHRATAARASSVQDAVSHSLEGAVAALLTICPDGVGRLSIGATGLWGHASRFDSSVLAPLDPEELLIADDGLTAHLGALHGRPGVVVAVGTGLVAVSLDADGRACRVGGYGLWIDDRGAGAWIGQRALRVAIDTVEHLDNAHAVLRVCEAELGPHTEWPARLADGRQPQLLASLCDPLAKLAESDDFHARAIFELAGAHIGRRIRAACLQAGAAGRTLDHMESARTDNRHAASSISLPVVVTGGVAAALDLLSPGLSESTGDLPIHFEPAQGTPLDGAELLLNGATALQPSPLLRHVTSGENTI